MSEKEILDHLVHRQRYDPRELPPSDGKSDENRPVARRDRLIFVFLTCTATCVFNIYEDYKTEIWQYYILKMYQSEQKGQDLRWILNTVELGIAEHFIRSYTDCVIYVFSMTHVGKQKIIL